MMQVTSPARTVVVVGRGHQDAWAQIGARDPGMVLVQPRNVDTAPGIFLPLTYIRARCVTRMTPGDCHSPRVKQDRTAGCIASPRGRRLLQMATVVR